MPPGPNLVLVRQGAAFDGRSSRGLQAHPTESYHNMVAVVLRYVCMVALIRYGLIPGLYDYD